MDRSYLDHRNVGCKIDGSVNLQVDLFLGLIVRRQVLAGFAQVILGFVYAWVE